MNIFRNPEHLLQYLSDIIQCERQRHYWTCLMKANIESLRKEGIGGGNLSSNEIKSIKELYHKAPKFSNIFHKFYTQATGLFFPHYMPDSLYYQYVDPYYNNWKMAQYIDHKGLYKDMFHGVRQPKLLGCRMNGYWYDGNGLLVSLDTITSLMFCSKSCFIKQAMDSEGGHGIVFVDIPQHTKENVKKILTSSTYDVVVQEGLEQSPVLSAINSSSVNTIRLLTLFTKAGDVKIYSVILRMGINGAKVDNASSGGITVGVEKDGRLKPVAYNAKGKRFDRHPTSGVKFDDYIIPNFESVKTTVKDLATRLPHFRLVSWDVALDTENNPVIIEANLKFGEIDFHQLNNGPLFGEDTKLILDEVFGAV